MPLARILSAAFYGLDALLVDVEVDGFEWDEPNCMVIVGLPYSHQGQMTLDEIVGGTPYGATTIAGATGSRQPSAIELAGAKHQGQLIAETAKKLFPG